MEWIIVLLVLFCLYQRHETNDEKGKKHEGSGTNVKERGTKGARVKRQDQDKLTVTGCPYNWIRYGDSDRCYFISTGSANFSEAKKYCESKNSELIPPMASFAEVFLSSMLAYSTRDSLEFWIGVKKWKGSDYWTTTRGLALGKNHQFWAEGFPNGRGRCVFMSLLDNRKRGDWRNEKCDRRLKYVCIRCPNYFYYVPEVDQCFRLNLQLKNWSDAEDACAKMKSGARLLSIGNSVKQGALRRYLKNQFAGKESDVCHHLNREKTAWIGGTTKDPNQCTASYVWNPKKPAETPFTFEKWHCGMPFCFPSIRSSCTATSQKLGYQWGNDECDIRLCSVCEFD